MSEYFKSFDPKNITPRDFKIPDEWPKIHSIDIADPAWIVSIAYDPESGKYYIYERPRRRSAWQRFKVWIRRVLV